MHGTKGSDGWDGCKVIKSVWYMGSCEKEFDKRENGLHTCTMR